MGRRQDGICPTCGKRPKRPGRPYCLACDRKYKVAYQREWYRRHGRGRSQAICPRREVVYDPPGDKWDFDMVRALVEVLRRIEIRIERRPSGQIRRVLIYRGREVKF